MVERIMELQQSGREPGKDSWPFPHNSKSGHPITTQVATVDGFNSVASYYSLDRRLHYSVPVKHEGEVGGSRSLINSAFGLVTVVKDIKSNYGRTISCVVVDMRKIF